MKWFKHDAGARNDVKIKLLKLKFGAEGYGVYFQLLEIISENVKERNYDEWGQVESIHNVDTLALECGVSPDKLRKILEYCNEIDLLHKIDDKLTVPNILDRLADYAQRKAREADKFDVSQRKQDLIQLITGDSPANRTPKNRTEEKRTEKKREEKATSKKFKPLASQKYLLNMPDTDLDELSSKYKCSPNQIIKKGEELHNYCLAHGKRYKNYRSFLVNALIRDFGYRSQEEAKIPEVEEVSPEEQARVKQKMKALRSEFKKMPIMPGSK